MNIAQVEAETEARAAKITAACKKITADEHAELQALAAEYTLHRNPKKLADLERALGRIYRKHGAFD